MQFSYALWNTGGLYEKLERMQQKNRHFPHLAYSIEAPIVIAREILLSSLPYYDTPSSAISTSWGHDGPLVVVSFLFLWEDFLTISEYSSILTIFRCVTLYKLQSLLHFSVCEYLLYSVGYLRDRTIRRESGSSWRGIVYRNRWYIPFLLEEKEKKYPREHEKEEKDFFHNLRSEKIDLTIKRERE
jgi:hypothetical protein